MLCTKRYLVIGRIGLKILNDLLVLVLVVALFFVILHLQALLQSCQKVWIDVRLSKELF